MLVTHDTMSKPKESNKQYFHDIELKFRKHLIEIVMPFWITHAVDRKKGGILSFLSDEGSIISSHKHIISNSRALWTFSALLRRIGPDKDWMEAADLIYNFLVRYGRDEKGYWVYVVDNNGKVLIGENSIITDAFAILGLTEYYLLTGNNEALKIALETAFLVRDRLSHPGSYRTAPYLTPVGMKAHREAMQFSLVFCELGKAAHNEELITEGLAYGKSVLDSFWQPQKKILLEYMRTDGRPDDSPIGRVMVPGHAIESLWFQIHNFSTYGCQDSWRAKVAAKAIRPCVEKGWDKEYGGIFLAVDVEGKKPVCWKYAEMKRWWPVTEAFPALLMAYEQLRESWAITWFKKVLDWAWEVFPNWEHGDWHQNVSREGIPINRVDLDVNDTWVAYDLAVKDPFHLPRSLLYSIETLHRLQKDGGYT